MSNLSEQVHNFILKQSKIYLQQGKKPPKGVQVMRGKRGGLYYLAQHKKEDGKRKLFIKIRDQEEPYCELIDDSYYVTLPKDNTKLIFAAHELGHIRNPETKNYLEEEKNAWRYGANLLQKFGRWDSHAKKVASEALSTYYTLYYSEKYSKRLAKKFIEEIK